MQGGLHWQFVGGPMRRLLFVVLLLIAVPAGAQRAAHRDPRDPYGANGLTFGTTNIPTTSTAPTSGQCVEYNGTGFQGAACSGGSGNGTVNSAAGPKIAQYPTGTGTIVNGVTVSGDCTIADGGAMTCTKTGGTAFGALATLGIGADLVQSGANLAVNIIEVAHGGLNTSTAPSAAQIPVAQSASAYAPETVSGDATLASNGALTVTKTSGTAFGPLATQTAPCTLAQGCTGTATPALLAGTGLSVAGTFPAQTFTLQTPVAVANGGVGIGTAPSAGQLLVAQTASAYAPETVSGDATITTGGVVANQGLTFGATDMQLNSTAPSTGQCLAWDGAKISGAACAAGSGVVTSSTGPNIAQYSAGTGATVGGVPISGDATLAQGGALTVKGMTFGATDLQAKTTAPTSGQCLVYDGVGITGGACGGTGVANALLFGATQQALSATAPTTGQFLTWNGTNWVGGSPSGSGTVASGGVGQVPYYASAGTTLSGNANVTATSAGIVTVGGMVNNCKGFVTLSSGVGTATNACITGTSFPLCVDTTTFNSVSCTPNTGTMAIAGTGSDVIAWIIVG